jgi:hypothetical protein
VRRATIPARRVNRTPKRANRPRRTRRFLRGAAIPAVPRRHVPQGGDCSVDRSVVP